MTNILPCPICGRIPLSVKISDGIKLICENHIEYENLKSNMADAVIEWNHQVFLHEIFKDGGE